MPKLAAPEYRTTNWPEYNAALKRRGSLEIWFDPQIHWLSKPCGSPSRPMRFSNSAIELCLTLKVLFNLLLRQVTGLVASLIKLAGLDWPVPDYTTPCRRQKTLKVELGGRPSCLVPVFDGASSTGEWKEALWARFYTGAPRRQRSCVERYSIVKRA